MLYNVQMLPQIRHLTQRIETKATKDTIIFPGLMSSVPGWWNYTTAFATAK
jgi:hypothetical protein